MSSNIKSIFFFSICFGLGLSVFFSVSEDMTVQREPAAINGKIFQIGSLSSEEIKSQLIHKIKVTPTIEGMKSIQLSGFSSALCKTYPEIEMQFQAEGVAVGGEAPTMTIKAPCSAGQDPADIAAIQLPVSQILNQTPKNAEFRFNGYAARLEFSHAAEEWPKQWVLQKVQFKTNSGHTKTASFERLTKTNKTNDRLIVLEF